MPTPSLDQDRQVVSAWWRQLCSWLWKVSGFLGTAVILSLGVNILSTWLTSSQGSIPFDSPFARLLMHWPIVLLVGCCLLMMAVLARALSREPTRSIPPLLTKQNRERMLQRLRRSYRELSEQSLQGTVRLELELADRPGAVQNTTSLVLRQSNQREQILPAGTSIVQIYEQAAHELLILGMPGAGKSVLLYQLGSHLVEQAERDETLPLPILLPLSSWAVKRPALQEWIHEQLCSPLLYNVPRQVSRQWIQDEQILLLLDGLDEMEEAARPACIAAINTYHREHLHPLVVCSRNTEYEAAAERERLTLQSAVVIQPLTHEQVDTSLIQAGKPLAALRSELKKNAELQDLATSPLWLSILLLTYQGTTVRTLPRQRAALQQTIFASYVERMVQRKGNNKCYPLDLTTKYLSWLAGRMRTHNQTIFSVELLQPNWLPERSRAFYRWSVGLVDGLARPESKIELTEVITWSWRNIRSFIYVPLTFALLVGLWNGLYIRLVAGVAAGVVTGVVTGVVIGLLFGLPLGFSMDQLTDRFHLSPNEGIQRSAQNGLIVGLFVGLGFSLVLGLILGLAFGSGYGLVLGLLIELSCGLILGLQIIVQHYTLRVFLWHTGVFPWRAVRFLEDAQARILLRRIGGSYSFVHRLLLDYFADLDPAASPGSTPAHTTSPSGEKNVSHHTNRLT